MLSVALLCVTMNVAAHAGYVQNSVSEISFPVTEGVYGAYLSGFDYAANGNIIAYAGTNVVEVNQSGTVIQTLYEGAYNSAASFVKVDRSTGKIYFGESYNGEIRVMNSDGSGQSLLATIANNYDMVIDSAGRLIVSAGSLDWTSTNLFSLNAAAGDSYQFGSVSGPAGPMALSTTGDLYYGVTTFGATSTTHTILSWAQSLVDSAITGGEAEALSGANSTNVLTGDRGISGMAMDEAGHIYYTSGGNPGGVWKVTDGSRSKMTQTDPNGYHWLTTLRYNQNAGTVGVAVGNTYDDSGNPIGVIANVVAPEPSSLLAFASFGGLAFAMRRRRRAYGESVVDGR